MRLKWVALQMERREVETVSVETSYAVMSRREKVVVNWKCRVCRKFL